jgi:predicted naringenin-chalcone synthase
LELLEDAGEVGLGLFEGEAAEAVVAAELYDDDLRVAGEDAGDAVEAVLGGVAADAVVDYAVVVALGVEVALEVVGVGLAEVGAVACGEGVAEAEDQCRAVGRAARRARARW